MKNKEILILLILFCLILLIKLNLHCKKKYIEDFNACIISTCKPGYSISTDKKSCTPITSFSSNTTPTLINNFVLVSSDGIYILKFVGTDLQLLDTTITPNTKIWNSNTSSISIDSIQLNTNGNLLFISSGIVKANTNSIQTTTNATYKLTLKVDGTLEITDNSATPVSIWTSGTVSAPKTLAYNPIGEISKSQSDCTNDTTKTYTWLTSSNSCVKCSEYLKSIGNINTIDTTKISSWGDKCIPNCNLGLKVDFTDNTKVSNCIACENTSGVLMWDS